MSWTLGEIHKRRMQIYAHCHVAADCTHYAPVDMEALIGRFGADFDIIERRRELLASFICSRCGRKGMDIRLVPIDTPTAEGGHSLTG